MLPSLNFLKNFTRRSCRLEVNLSLTENRGTHYCTTISEPHNLSEFVIGTVIPSLFWGWRWCLRRYSYVWVLPPHFSLCSLDTGGVKVHSIPYPTYLYIPSFPQKFNKLALELRQLSTSLKRPLADAVAGVVPAKKPLVESNVVVLWRVLLPWRKDEPIFLRFVHFPQQTTNLEQFDATKEKLFYCVKMLSYSTYKQKV